MQALDLFSDVGLVDGETLLGNCSAIAVDELRAVRERASEMNIAGIIEFWNNRLAQLGSRGGREETVREMRRELKLPRQSRGAGSASEQRQVPGCACSPPDSRTWYSNPLLGSETTSGLLATDSRNANPSGRVALTQPKPARSSTTEPSMCFVNFSTVKLII